jgi:ABC-type uncharacterized transport system substrate-binding protein
MRSRREFITLLGSAAAGQLSIWARMASAQPAERIRLIAVLMNTVPDEDQLTSVAAFRQTLAQSGWTEGRDTQIDVRWAGGGAAEIRRHASELVALGPDVILATGTAGMGPLLQATRTIPIVFCNVADPVGAGFVKSLARPGGNTTGFVQFEYTLSGKWLELLKQLAPNMTRVAVLRDANITAGIGQFAVIQSVAPALGVEVSVIDLRDAGEIEAGITDFVRSPNGGLILTSSALAVVHGPLIVSLATRYKVPLISYRRFYAARGALISYGYDVLDHYRRAAGYVDRILKGEKPADLPVQTPTKYELAINLRTAKTLGIEVPVSLLARADEVIE